MTKRLKLAQRFNAAFLGIDPDYYSFADPLLAILQTRAVRARYKAPHAYESPMPKPRYKRPSWRKRLFKGHRI